MTAAELLDRAAELIRQEELGRRESFFEAGRLISQSIAAYLREGQGKDLVKRGRRHGAMVLASEKTGLPIPRINYLIRTAAAVDLLGDGDPGGLYWASVRYFSRFIRRKPLPPTGRRSVRAEDLEVWEIKPEFAATARAVFRKAADAGLNEIKAAKLVLEHGGRPRPSRHEKVLLGELRDLKVSRSEEGSPRLKEAAAIASPRDVAESLWQIVCESPDPEAVVRHLAEMVKQDKQARRFYKGPPCDDETGPGRNARVGDPVRPIRSKRGAVSV